MKKNLVFFLTIFTFLSCYIPPYAFKTLQEQQGIGLIEIKGIIREYRETIEQIKYFEENKNIKAILVYIDSPGGGVVPSNQIYKSIKRFKEKTGKPVVAYFSSLGASGGYYIACGADKIMADPNTLTGSIGVIAEFLHFEELFKKIGVSFTILKTGKFKDIGSPFRPMAPEEKELLQDMLRDVYEQFLEVISSARGMEIERVREIADGRIFSGRQALKEGLVDTLGTYEECIEWIAQLAKIKGKPKIIKPPRKLKGLLWRILNVDELFPYIRVEYRIP